MCSDIYSGSLIFSVKRKDNTKSLRDPIISVVLCYPFGYSNLDYYYLVKHDISHKPQ